MRGKTEKNNVRFAAVQLLSLVQLFATPWTAGRQASLSLTIYWGLPKLMSIESVMPSNHHIFCHPILFLPSIFPASSGKDLSRVFSNESGLQVASGGQSIGASASVSVLTMNIQGWFPLRLTGLISLLSKGLLRVFSSTIAWKHQFFSTQPFLLSSSHIRMITGKTIALTRRTFFGKGMSLLFNMLPRFVIAFLPRSEHLLISWLQSPSAVILEPPKIKSLIVSIVSPSICHEVMGLDAMIFVFECCFKPTFSLSPFIFIQRLFSSSSLSAMRVVLSAYLRLLILLPQSWYTLGKKIHPLLYLSWPLCLR